LIASSIVIVFLLSFVTFRHLISLLHSLTPWFSFMSLYEKDFPNYNRLIFERM
jgi:hypothetical protein